MLELLLAWRDVGFVLYAALKAFLPLPSLEVLLIPLCVSQPEAYLRFSVEGAIGTGLGGLIGYLLAYRFREAIVQHLISAELLEKGQRLMQKHGVLAVFIGGITPIPDFILPYLAGLTHMNFLAFSLTDGFSRFLRSYLIGYSIYRAADVVDFQTYGNLFCVALLFYALIRWGKERYYRSSTSLRK